MLVTCAQCDTEFEAKRSTAKYCGPACRQRKRRRAPRHDSPEETRTLADVTRAELVKLGKLDTIVGYQALEVARRMPSPRETGAGVTALSKELSRLMLLARAGTQAADPVDQVKRKRDEKLAKARQA